MEVYIRLTDEESKRSAEITIKGLEDQRLEFLKMVHGFMMGDKAGDKGPQLRTGEDGRTHPTDDFLAHEVAELMMKDWDSVLPAAPQAPAPEPKAPEPEPEPEQDGPKPEPPTFPTDVSYISKYGIMKENGVLTGPSLFGRWPELHTMVEEARKHPNPKLEYSLCFDESGHPKFQVYYRCSCDHKGRRFVYDRSTYCKCHACDNRLAIEYAGSGQNPQDDFGNYFLANKEFQG